MDAASGATGGQDASKLAAAAAAAAAKKKVNAPINTQDVIYKLPFKYGWKRELVSGGFFAVYMIERPSG